MSAGHRRQLVVDSDGGVDDAIALAWLLQRDDVEVVAVFAVWGNVAVTQAARNLRIVLEAFDQGHIPVHVGRAGPYEPAPHIGVADFVHGTDGLADIGLHDPQLGPVAGDGVEALVELAASDRTLLTLGPLTNIATAISLDPSFAGRWADVVVMGGASADAGNALPGAEANVAHDPIAAGALVAGSWRRPPLLVGLDATQTATLGPEDVALLHEERNDAARFVTPLFDFYRVKGGSFCTPGECPCHDLLAAVAAVDPSVVEIAELPATVVTDPGPAWGTTLVDRRWVAWRQAADFHEQDAHCDLHPIRWAVRGERERFRHHVRSWWS